MSGAPTAAVAKRIARFAFAFRVSSFAGAVGAFASAIVRLTLSTDLAQASRALRRASQPTRRSPPRAGASGTAGFPTRPKRRSRFW